MKPGSRQLLFIPMLAALMGIFGAFTAYGLMKLIAIISNFVFFQKFSTILPLTLAHHKLGAWVILVPSIGAILVGVMARFGSSKICGHGIPEAMEAVWLNKSRIAPRVAILKPLSAAIAIGTGGPFGAEGPIIQTGGALGSLLGQILQVSANERKILLACGAVAGMTGIFNTPIAAVVFAIELLLFEFSGTTVIPLTVAATIAAALRQYLIGPSPMFLMRNSHFGGIYALPGYLLLGVICGIGAALFNRAFYSIEVLFDKIPWDPFGRLILGAVGLGIIGYILPQVMGVGYQSITDLLNARLALSTACMLLIMKTIALLVSLGSGTSGGLLAPMFTMGAAVGCLLAGVMGHFWPQFTGLEGGFALAGMGALFAASSRSTFAFILFAFEITQVYASIVPLMLSAVTATSIAWLLSQHSIMTERLAQRGLSVHHVYEVDPFRRLTVADAMVQPICTIDHKTTLNDFCINIDQQQAVAVINERKQVIGIITPRTITKALMDAANRSLPIENFTTPAHYVYSNEIIHDVLPRMEANDIEAFVVINQNQPAELIGWIDRRTILNSRLHYAISENKPEPGWIFQVGNHGA
ncbi:MAG TPA: chloride channel protein [Burkholderiales bacterium]|nr:chloride channel protein [Burkholderiales bacterium]